MNQTKTSETDTKATEARFRFVFFVFLLESTRFDNSVCVPAFERFPEPLQQFQVGCVDG